MRAFVLGLVCVMLLLLLCLFSVVVIVFALCVIEHIFALVIVIVIVIMVAVIAVVDVVVIVVVVVHQGCCMCVVCVMLRACFLTPVLFCVMGYFVIAHQWKARLVVFILPRQHDIRPLAALRQSVQQQLCQQLLVKWGYNNARI